MPLAFLGSDRVSPTAFYTGHVWLRNGLSHPAFGTLEGRLMYEALRPTMTVLGVAGAPTLEDMLLARHRVIDAILAEAIEAGRVGTVIELACGMSPRGWRFARRFGDAIAYVEADLPAMARRKERRLRRLGALGRHHRVVAFDVTAGRLADLAPAGGAAVVTEGLLNYLPEPAVLALWRQIAALPGGLYVSDLAVGGTRDGVLASTFVKALSVFVQGQVHSHFDGAAGAEAALLDAGFEAAAIHDPSRHPAAGDRQGRPGARMLQVLEAASA